MAGSPDSVLFDLGGVLFRYFPERRLERLVRTTGLAGDIIHGEIWASDYDQTCERGGLNAAQSHVEFCRRLDIEMSYTDFAAAMADAFEPDADVVGLARRVAAGHDVAVLTNNWEVVEEALVADYPELTDVFGPNLYFTWRFKARKPDPLVFETALERWGKRVEQVLFVDDSENNVAGAEAFGLEVHHFTDAVVLEAELRARGLI